MSPNEEEVTRVLNKVGLQTTLTVLVDWCRKQWLRPGETEMPWWMETTLNLLRGANDVYARRHQFDDDKAI